MLEFEIEKCDNCHKAMYRVGNDGLCSKCRFEAYEEQTDEVCQFCSSYKHRDKRYNYVFCPSYYCPSNDHLR